MTLAEVHVKWSVILTDRPIDQASEFTLGHLTPICILQNSRKNGAHLARF